jgi:hypothetical protein
MERFSEPWNLSVERRRVFEIYLGSFSIDGRRGTLKICNAG